MSEIGPIALFGSGETSPIAQRIHQRVMELLAAPIRGAIVETPAGFEPNAAGVAQKIIDYLEHRLQNFRPTLVSIPARKRGTAFSPDDPAIVAPLLAANYLFMGPGSPTYAARQLMDSYLWHAMLARHRLGAALCFSSASTIAISQHAMPIYEIYKVGEDLHWKAGLDFFGNFGLSLVVVPHWNNSDGGEELDTSHCYLGAERYQQLLAMAPNPVTVLGIEENTGLVIRPTTGRCEVIGSGAVVIVRDGTEVRYNSKDCFAATELGAWQLPAQQDAIPAVVWQDALAAMDSVAERDDVAPPPDVVALADKRHAARQAKEWHAADRLRDELAALGWQVNDTPDGPELSRIQ
ncbi:MAG: hypothetical protein KDE53_15320 [Caldilineaceae bacterium]|nr:hypothetical protein [Caldilineaceae bacterium]